MRKQSSIISILIFFLLFLTACSQDNVNEHTETPVKTTVNEEDCKTILQSDINKIYSHDDAINYASCLIIDGKNQEAKEFISSIRTKLNYVADKSRVFTLLDDSASYLDDKTGTYNEYLELNKRYSAIDSEYRHFKSLLFDVERKLTDRALNTEDFKLKQQIAEYDKKYYDPKIGMTAEEVKKSTWGEPKKINKTTTAYGVSEQWVYYGDRYIYLENGVVTSIQE